MFILFLQSLCFTPFVLAFNKGNNVYDLTFTELMVSYTIAFELCVGLNHCFNTSHILGLLQPSFNTKCELKYARSFGIALCFFSFISAQHNLLDTAGVWICYHAVVFLHNAACNNCLNMTVHICWFMSLFCCVMYD